jgi:hypothetical protein
MNLKFEMREEEVNYQSIKHKGRSFPSFSSSNLDAQQNTKIFRKKYQDTQRTHMSFKEEL